MKKFDSKNIGYQGGKVNIISSGETNIPMISIQFFLFVQVDSDEPPSKSASTSSSTINQKTQQASNASSSKKTLSNEDENVEYGRVPTDVTS